jgi:hypothetical protein
MRKKPGKILHCTGCPMQIQNHGGHPVFVIGEASLEIFINGGRYRQFGIVPT